jgi:hypothetical protein
MATTDAGTRAELIARWAWEDPPTRAAEGLRQVRDLAAGAQAGPELNEVGDTAVMLSRLVGALPEPDTLTNQMSAGSPDSLAAQLELASIHGHHIPGTQYTFRHGWIPLIGSKLNDKYPEWKVRQDADRAAAKAAKDRAARDIAALPEAAPPADKYAPAPPDAAKRKLSPEHQAMVKAHKEQMARADRAAAKASAPASPGRLGTAEEARKDSGAAHYETPVQAAEGEAKQRMQAAQEAGARTTGEALKQTDPGLASLAQPGADMAALKSYIDARVAAEVARQMGQITEQQHSELQKKMAGVHAGQQKLIAMVRRQAKENISEADHQDRTHLVMYNLFSSAGLAVAMGGLAAGLSPVQSMLAAAVVPLATTIHDYVRGM